MAEALRFLVINVSRIGDTLLATPAIRAIATAHPTAEITVLAHPKRREVLDHLPHVTRVGTISKQRAVWRGWLGGRRYDYALVYGFDRALVAYALRVAQRVVAFRQRDPDLNRRLFAIVEPPPDPSEHGVLQSLRLPAALGIAPAGLRLQYRVTESETRWATMELAKTLPADARPLIGLQIASFPTKAFRDWPLEHFMALCARVLERYPHAHFLIFGGKQEHDRTARLKDRLGNHARLYAGHLSLRQTAALMARLDLYIGVDTGPTHMMGCFDIPLVVLYHCHLPSYLAAPLEHPCAYIVDHPRGEGERSPEVPMAEISVDAVWDRVEAALQRQSRER